VLKSIVHFDSLRFKERDALEDIISSYYNSHTFDMEKLRDQRLRHHFAERYDHRKNVSDWDYSMYLKELCPSLHAREYKDWRLNGNAFETRLAPNTVPNRTMSSYIPGKAKKTKDNILVRGFWGDIVQSPFIPFGVEIWQDREKDLFGKKINFQQVYFASDFSSYNVQYYIQKLENETAYEFPFTRIKQIDKELGGEGKINPDDKDEPKIEEIKEDGDKETNMVNKLSK